MNLFHKDIVLVLVLGLYLGLELRTRKENKAEHDCNFRKTQAQVTETPPSGWRLSKYHCISTAVENESYYLGELQCPTLKSQEQELCYTSVPHSQAL